MNKSIQTPKSGSSKKQKLSKNRDFNLSLEDPEDPQSGLDSGTKENAAESSIRVTISQGDLFYSKYPVMAGHFEDDGILYAEKTINNYLNGALSQQHQLGLYPGAIGTSGLFLPGQGGFKGAVIVGLGKPEDLTASELMKTVEQGVANYLNRLNSIDGQIKPGDEPAGTGISSLVIGSGYAGLSIENSIKAIIQGIQNANGKIRNLKLKTARFIEHAEFVEIFEDKAVTSLYSLCRIEKEESRSFRISMEEKKINILLGSKIRIPNEEGDGWWNRVTVTKKACDDHDGLIKCLNFSTSTYSAQEKEQELPTTPVLIEETIEGMSTENEWTAERAKAIFELLIPNDFKDQLRKHGNINWILDEYTASYPWELLQDSVADAMPMCVSAGMIRQLKGSHYRAVVRSTENLNALVIADPDLQGFASQLPGALKEGKMVSEMLQERGMNTTSSFRGKHSEIIEKLFRDDYKIIHLSGHGIFNQDASRGSGMVIGKKLFLSTREIGQMSYVPELVFVNCCYLGKIRDDAEELYQQRYKLAANMGTQLIENGVKCVIAAGWAVNDEAAIEFARVFYQHMFDGYNFGEAIKEARTAVYENFDDTNTWGAYQCYGDPYYRFRHIQRMTKAEEKTYMIAQEAEVDLINLSNELEIGKLPSDEYLKMLKIISVAVDNARIRNSFITEKEALIYLDLREYDLACAKFKSLLEMEDASFSFSVLGKMYNARAKQIINDKDRQDDSSKGLDELDKIIKNIESLIKISKNLELINILGSTYKRKAILLKEKPAKMEAFESAAFYYHLGYAIFGKWYPLTNWLTLEAIFVMSGMREWASQIKTKAGTYDLPSPEGAVEMLDRLNCPLTTELEIMNYWDMIAAINIRLCRYILNFSGLEARDDLDKILADIGELWKKAGSRGKRFAEIEHLDFIIDVLKASDKESVIKLKKNLLQLKEGLVKLL